MKRVAKVMAKVEGKHKTKKSKKKRRQSSEQEHQITDCVMCDEEAFHLLKTVLVCSQCKERYHEQCCEPPLNAAIVKARNKKWECPDCTICQVCETANESDDENMIMCEMCD